MYIRVRVVCTSVCEVKVFGTRPAVNFYTATSRFVLKGVRAPRSRIIRVARAAFIVKFTKTKKKTWNPKKPLLRIRTSAENYVDWKRLLYMKWFCGNSIAIALNKVQSRWWWCDRFYAGKRKKVGCEKFRMKISFWSIDFLP